MPEAAVGLMAKYPELGKVKTRLAAEIGDVGALRVYTQMLQISSELLRRLDSQRFKTAVFVGQSNFVEKFRTQYPGAEQYHAQVNGDLGKRMKAALKKLLAPNEVDCAILIGADIPDLSAELIEEAAIALKKQDVVFGPTLDGGYYLVGMQKVVPQLFEGIEWSSTAVLRDSKSIAKELGLKVKLLRELTDLDTLKDVHKLTARNQLIIDTLNTYLDQSTSREQEHE